MQIRVGMEQNNEGRDLAWALDYPGCFAYGKDSSEAVINLARELIVYDAWIEQHMGSSWVQLGDYDLRIVDTWQVFTMNDHYELQDGAYAVNAWFREDWKPLTSQDIERGLQLLSWSREDLLDAIDALTDEILDAAYPGERWSIRGILKHVANAEWWYLERLNLTHEGHKRMPKDAVERLRWSRDQLIAALPELGGRELVIGREGEFWSPRKLLRRALWHEINHRQHIQKLLSLQDL